MDGFIDFPFKSHNKTLLKITAYFLQSGFLLVGMVASLKKINVTPNVMGKVLCLDIRFTDALIASVTLKNN